MLCQHLLQWQNANLCNLLPLVYWEVRHLAAQKLSGEPASQTLQAAALVHEAHIRLVGAEGQNWSGRRHFFAGLTIEQAGEVLKVSRRTAYGYRSYARARKHRELAKQE
jgi:hypothetical protein